MSGSLSYTTTFYSWLIQLSDAPSPGGTQTVVAETDLALSPFNSGISLTFVGTPGAGSYDGLAFGSNEINSTYSGYFGTDPSGNAAGPIVQIGNTFYLLSDWAIGVAGGTTLSSGTASSPFVTDVAQSLCLLEGTLIATPFGPRAIELLVGGDLVITAAGEVRRIAWVGYEAVSNGRARAQYDQPVRISADAFGPGMPDADLWLSPDHAVFSSGVLIPARCLVNDGSVMHVARSQYTYWHVCLETHDVILAQGLPVESLLADFDTLDGFDNAGSAPYPDPFAAPCAPVVTQGPVVERVRAVLARQSALVG